VRFTRQLQGSSAPHEFFAIRESVRENKSAVGRRLIDVDGYTFRVFVTNRQGDGAELWRDYNLLSLYLHASAQEQRCKQPSTSSSAGWPGQTQATYRQHFAMGWSHFAEVAARRQADKRDISGETVRRLDEIHPTLDFALKQTLPFRVLLLLNDINTIENLK
jgi:hypothetical protein